MDLEKKLAELEAELAVTKDQIAAQAAIIDALSEENKSLSKELAIAEQKYAAAEAEKKDASVAAEANAIMSDLLASSSLSDKLKVKVVSLFSHNAYRTADGELDKEAFAAAFRSEINDWEERLGESATSLSVGVATEKVDGISASVDDDIKLGQSIARALVGKIRSDA